MKLFVRHSTERKKLQEKSASFTVYHKKGIGFFFFVGGTRYGNS